MALMQKLALKQGQSLVMTPQLQQAIKLLQMSHLELQEFIDQELERNPLLERGDGLQEKAVAPADDTPDAPFAEGEAHGADGDGNISQSDAALPASKQGEPMLDSAWKNMRKGGTVSLDDEAGDFASALAAAETLSDHLTAQLHLHIRDARDLLIGQHAIGMVNEQGYLTASAPDMAQTLGAPVADVARVLATLKTFDPAGVFAENLQECLALQLKDRGHYDPAMATMIENLPLVARRDFEALKKLCGLPMSDIHDMIAELRQLNPKPGNAFGSDPVSPVVPDVQVRTAPDGSWIVELNSETLPRVLVNETYAATVSRHGKQDEKEYLTACQQQASWLVKSLDQRARTILKVAQEIVRQQDAFLVLGVAHLRPITLRMVADEIKMHESTVSRVTSNKYMATPRGVFELKYFFTNAIASADADGAQHSSESVRHRIKELIDGEGADGVLSDDDLVEKLKAESIEIARRTVAKYRESLGILSSVQRRREARARQN